jgi:hypothetical protein
VREMEELYEQVAVWGSREYARTAVPRQVG